MLMCFLCVTWPGSHTHLQDPCPLHERWEGHPVRAVGQVVSQQYRWVKCWVGDCWVGDCWEMSWWLLRVELVIVELVRVDVLSWRLLNWWVLRYWVGEYFSCNSENLPVWWPGPWPLSKRKKSPNACHEGLLKVGWGGGCQWQSWYTSCTTWVMCLKCEGISCVVPHT